MCADFGGPGSRTQVERRERCREKRNRERRVAQCQEQSAVSCLKLPFAGIVSALVKGRIGSEPPRTVMKDRIWTRVQVGTEI